MGVVDVAAVDCGWVPVWLVPRWLARRRAHTWGVTCLCWLCTMVGGCNLRLVGCGARVVSVNGVCGVLGCTYVCGFRWGDIGGGVCGPRYWLTSQASLFIVVVAAVDSNSGLGVTGGLYPKPQIPCGLQVDSRWIPGVQVDF
jgi:hypothetical protein